MMIKCIAIDDEPLALKIIEKYVSELPSLELVHTFPDALDAMEFLRKENIDVIFLDINMPKLSGVSFVKSMTKMPHIIFTTAYPEYAVDGFELEAVDYLLKPFSFDRFIKAVKKVEEKIEKASGAPANYLFIKSDKKFYRTDYADILYFEAYGDYVKVYTKQKMLLTKQKLVVLEKELPPSHFMQIHRKYIVSTDAIDYLEGNTVKIGNIKLPISNARKELVFNKLNPK